jgi:hypothetical protein
MKAYGAVDAQIHVFLTSTLVGGEWLASRPCRFTPGERATGTHRIGGRVGPKAGLDHMEKRKFLTLPEFEFRPLGSPTKLFAIPTTLPRLLLLRKRYAYMRG